MFESHHHDHHGATLFPTSDAESSGDQLSPAELQKCNTCKASTLADKAFLKAKCREEIGSEKTAAMRAQRKECKYGKTEEAVTRRAGWAAEKCESSCTKQSGFNDHTLAFIYNRRNVYAHFL